MNFIPARLEDGIVKLPFGDAPIPNGADAKNRDVIAGIRPEHFEDAQFDDRDATDRLHFKVGVDVVESMGSELYAYFDVKGAEELHSDQLDELAADAGHGRRPRRRRRPGRRAPGRPQRGRARQGDRARPGHEPDQALRPRRRALAHARHGVVSPRGRPRRRAAGGGRTPPASSPRTA